MRRIFIYGTLKRKHPNHGRLFADAIRPALFLGQARTSRPYPLCA